MLVFGAVVLGGMGLVALLISGRQRMRELAIKERISLIEKGLVPSPETDPARFESFVGLRPPHEQAGGPLSVRRSPDHGVGLGLALLISFAGANRALASASAADSRSSAWRRSSTARSPATTGPGRPFLR